MNEVAINVIVPVYNVEKYLDEFASPFLIKPFRIIKSYLCMTSRPTGRWIS